MSLAPAVAQLAAADLVSSAVRVVGLAVVSGVVAAVVAVVYRWYARVRIPEGLAVLAGLALVAIYLNTDAALSQVIGGGTGLLDPAVAARNVVSFLLAAGGAMVGRRAGDRLAVAAGVVSGARELDVDLSRLVKPVGRVITVTLPEDAADIEDIEAYDPVPAETKAALAGRTLVFPRGLTVAALQERFVDRLKEDHGVGHVDVELGADGTIDYLAVGSRAAGIGPTLVPGTAATALLGDPPFSATTGDVVQAWADGERVATGEVRGVAGDVVTLALDEVDAESVDPAGRHRLVTLPREPRADREFASLLRRADETMGVLAVGPDGPLAGRAVGDVDLTVVAVKPADGQVEAIPARTRTLGPGDRLYVIARPEALRRLEAGGASVDGA